MKTKTSLKTNTPAAPVASNRRTRKARAVAQKPGSEPLLRRAATKPAKQPKVAESPVSAPKSSGWGEQVREVVTAQGAAGMRDALELLTGAGGAAMPDLLPVSLLAVDQACSLLHSEALETWNALVDEGRDPARVNEWTHAVLAGAQGRMDAAVANTQKALALLARANVSQ